MLLSPASDCRSHPIAHRRVDFFYTQPFEAPEPSAQAIDSRCKSRIGSNFAYLYIKNGQTAPEKRGNKMKMGTPIAGLLLGIAAASWGAQAKATPIEFDMVFFGDDFAQISEFDGGFVYDDTNGFVSNFFVDLDSYGSFFLPDAVPASALHLGSPPSIAFDSNIVVDLEGGLTASVSLFNTTNVFGIFQDNGTFDTLLREGFYQILPASVVSVPEPPSLALIAAGILLLLLMGARRKQRSS